MGSHHERRIHRFRRLDPSGSQPGARPRDSTKGVHSSHPLLPGGADFHYHYGPLTRAAVSFLPKTTTREGTYFMTLGSKSTPGIVASKNIDRSAEGRFSRRLFSKRIAGLVGVGAVAATTGLGLGQQASAQSASGQGIANFALQFVGYPYVWAGNTPAGFDCSGFTQYVVLNTLGIDITHSTEMQMGYGAWVDWGNWMPGDLVYFAGTWGEGISHTGVYIGDGQMVHAENEGTGVCISSLYSDYYSGHYYGAIRLA